MPTTTLRVCTILLGLCLGSGTALAAKVEPVPVKPTQVEVPTVKAPVPTVQPTAPAAKPGNDTLKAIQKPSAPPAVKVPTKSIEPETVRKVEPVKLPAVKPGPAMTTTPNLTKPAAPPTASMQKPQLDQQRLQQIRQIQDAGKVNAIRQMEQIQKGAAVMPETLPGGPDSRDNRPESMRPEIARDNAPEASKMIRDSMIGRGGPFNADPSTYIGPTGNSSPNLNRGPGTAAGAAGAPVNPGLAAIGPTKAPPTIVNSSTGHKEQEDGTTTEWINFEESDGSTTEIQRNEGRGEFTSTRTTQDKQGNTIITTITGRTGADGGPDVSETWNRRTVDASGHTIKYRFGEGHPHARQGAPNDNEVGQGSNCVGPSNWGCKGGKDDPMDMVTQPAHGDEIATIRDTSGKPSAGPAAVTNPGTHEGSSPGGGSRGTSVKEGAVDPEEVVPGAPVIAPSGPRPAPSPIGDEAIDAALGAHELKQP